MTVFTALAAASLGAWVYLIAAHGRFWRGGPELRAPAAPSPDVAATPLDIVVPARDEAPTVEACLRSLLAQTGTGPLRVILVDDGSTDGTGAIARAINDPRLVVLDGAPRPPGWSGKLWAVAQGVTRHRDRADPGFRGACHVLLTDADIVHAPGHAAALLSRSIADSRDLVSCMVRLNCTHPTERALIPAFVYFFQMLYPFARVNDPGSPVAAAAGGTVLLHDRALDRIGGIDAIRDALIDDVTLARHVARGGRVWLGHTVLARSLRPYPHAADIWRMIARTAYVQLRFSPLLLAGTIAGLALIFLVPALATLFGEGRARLFGLAAWALSAASFLPTLRRFRLSSLRAPLLPLVACFYMAATIGAAIDHHRGRGVVWRGRAYSPS